ncbi:MAG TPA: MerR family transcriptional regulator, partial [Candidatus Wunengus californicus]|uniref:MerR family transcriptional regulator n=1 Tax=Candidatus Wunengus californicus TaxID=3367619 RepID=UPI004029EBB5
PDIKPVKSQSNQRLYKRKDVEMLLAIKHLLYDEKFTINGARDHLKELMKAQSKQAEPVAAKAASGKTTDLFEKVSAQGKGKSESSGKVFSKLKGDLEWCLTELRK